MSSLFNKYVPNGLKHFDSTYSRIRKTILPHSNTPILNLQHSIHIMLPIGATLKRTILISLAYQYK
jgi:hypothetical protein